MRRNIVIFIALSVFSAFWGNQLYAAAESADNHIQILKQIYIDRLALEPKRNKNGQLGFHCEFSGLAVGLQGSVIKTQFVLRFRDGRPIKALAHGSSGATTKDGTLQRGVYLFAKQSLENISWKAFIPLKALQLPHGPVDIVARAGVYCGNIAWYRDQAFAVKPSGIEFIGTVLFDEVDVALKERSFHIPNPSGRKTTNPNIIESQLSLSFSSENAVSGLNGESLYSGVYFQLPDGKYVKPSPRCSKGNTGKQGQAQFQQVEAIHGNEADWQGQELKVPMDALELDPGQDNTVIAAYYMSSEGLWQVQKFEILIKGQKADDSALDRLQTSTDVSSPRKAKKGLPRLTGVSGSHESGDAQMGWLGADIADPSSHDEPSTRKFPEKRGISSERHGESEPVAVSASREEAQEQSLAAQLRIISLVVEPSRIAGGDKYGFTVALEIEDPEAVSKKEVPVGMRFQVLEGGSSLFRSEKNEYSCPNGQICFLKKIDLPSSTKPGEYQIEVICSYKGQTVRHKDELVIE
jgi:hypothetical protein